MRYLRLSEEQPATSRHPLVIADLSHIVDRIVSNAVWPVSVTVALWSMWMFWSAQGMRPSQVDEDVYAYVGWAWLEGFWPYLHSWDHKGPVVFAVAAARIAILGLDPNMLAIQQIALGAATSILLAGVAYRLWGSIPAALALLLGTLLWTQEPPAGGVMGTPGTLIGLFSTGAILAALATTQVREVRRMAAWVLLSGLCSGLALLTKPNALAGPVVGLIAVLMCCRTQRIRQRLWLVLLMGLGGLVPVLITAALFHAHDALGALYECYIAFNSARGGSMLEADGTWNLVQRGQATLLTIGVLRRTLIGAVIGGAALIATLAFVRKLKIDRIIRPPELIIPVWLLIELVAFVSNGSWPYHAFPVLPPIVLGMTWLAVALARVPAVLGRVCALALCLWCLTFLTISTALTRPPTEPVERQNPDWRRIVGAARDTTDPDEKIFVLTWNSDFIRTYIRRRSVTRYIHPVPLITRGYTSDERWGELVDSLEQYPPKVILIGTFGFETPTDLRAQLDRTLRWFDKHFVPPETLDATPYPQRERLKDFIASRYRVELCHADLCLLRRVTSEEIPPGVVQRDPDSGIRPRATHARGQAS